jgi:hypothetical protein
MQSSGGEQKLPIRRGAGVPLLALCAIALCSVWIDLSGGRRSTTTGLALAMPSEREQKIIFNRDIRPILSDRCFSCHGPDPNKRQAGLRLDRPDSAQAPLPHHPKLRAFIPGDPDHSEALRRILSTDAATIMPPPSLHRPLSDAEKQLIHQWLIEGGPYQEHWAFTRPVRPPIPVVQNTAWPKSDIDRFVLANLESNGLTPSKPADRATLIRRVSLDLTGLPPTPAEVDAFVADTSPNAYEKVVDRLLASPHYGEQMAVQWLDYARYADSHGYQSDPERHMWRWRDWVINAYNSNMPFDQFTIKQLAGDLLPNATVDDRIATGFNRNHRINDEGGIIAEEWRVEGVIDRVSTTSAVFLGLTMECCRCHDHKYDPITQKEFYSVSAYFNSVNEEGIGPGSTDKGINVAPVLKFPTPQQQQRMDELAAQITSLTSQLADAKKKIPEVVAKLDSSSSAIPEPAGLLLRAPLDGDLSATINTDATTAPTSAPTPLDAASTQASTQAVGGKLITGKFTGKGDPQFVEAPTGRGIRFEDTDSAVNLGDVTNFDRTDKFSFGAWIYRRGEGGIISRVDPGAALTGFDLMVSGEKVAVHLTSHWPENAIRVETKEEIKPEHWTHVFVTYNGSSQASGVRIYFDGKPQTITIGTDSLTGSIRTPNPLLIGSRNTVSPFDGDVADVRFYNRVLSPPEVGAIAFKGRVQKILEIAPGDRTKEQVAQLTAYVEATDPRIASPATELVDATQQHTELDRKIADTMVMEELKKPRDTFVLVRGQYDKHGEKVQPGVPAVLPPLPKDAPPNRLGLAQWIVDPANPLTARVQANRLWEKFFGVGIVKTSENLGTQSEWPSNPELLDYLATELLALHWDLKAFQKEIVMSAAYQQSSEMTPEMLDRDPENRLIERGPRFRLSAEQVRDQALAASGLLVETIGGPSARPYEPLDLWAGNNFGNLAKYIPDTGEGLYRRSIYTFIKRSAVPANLSIFDQPSREYCVIRRSRTDTPLQALDLLNDPTFVEASRMLAQHVMKDVGTSPADRIAAAFKRLTARPPTPDELRILLAGFQRELDRFTKQPADAAKLLAVGATPPDPKLNAPELAAYTLTTSIILNLDETVTRQ